MRLIRRGLGAVVGLGILYAAAALIGGLWLSEGEAPGGSVPVGLLRGPIHTDFLLPATPETRAALGFAAGAVPLDAPGVEWIVVGWGARDYYTTIGTWRDLSARAIWRGATGDEAVLRVDVAGPLAADHGLPMLGLTGAQYARLLDGIAADAAGGAIDHPGFSATDAFFPARGHVTLFGTCNAWIGRTLRGAGIAFGRWTPTAGAVTVSFRRLDRGDGGA